MSPAGISPRAYLADKLHHRRREHPKAAISCGTRRKALYRRSNDEELLDGPPLSVAQFLAMDR